MSSTLMTKVEEGEFWWGGAVHDGAKMPLSAHSVYAIDLRREGRGNQSAPFFVSSHGRTVWSEEPFAISFDHGILRAEGSAPILLEQHGATLREGYLGGMKAHFPFDGRCPERAFYVTPQFNTWVELRYDHNRQAVLDYAHSLLSNGYAPGVLMIDDTWQEDYGVWRFHPGRFSDPAGMVKELHEMGFAVMVWAVPVVSPDSAPFRKALNTPGALIRGRDGKPVLIEWWNGYSAAIDFTNEAGRAWNSSTRCKRTAAWTASSSTAAGRSSICPRRRLPAAAPRTLPPRGSILPHNMLIMKSRTPGRRAESPSTSVCATKRTPGTGRACPAYCPMRSTPR